jgi:hypothetical protein
MYLPLQRCGAVVLGVLAVLGPLGMRAHAQRRPVVVPPNPGLNPVRNPNPLVNPFAPARPFLGTAVLGSALQQRAILNNPVLFNAQVGQTLQNRAILNNQGLSNASSALGYGSLLNSAASGGYGGYGTQWMMNPYQGYLTGAASLTTANAQYQTTIQQAKLQRQEAIRSAYQTRRAAIEEAEYERAHMVDPDKIRQAELVRELDRARVSPPLTEVWSGRSLNTLLRNTIAQQAQGVRGPSVPLDEDTLRSINLTAGDTRGNVGLLKDGGGLQWPQPLSGEAFQEAREDLGRRLKHAVNTVQLNRGPDESTISDLQADLKKLNETLDASVNLMSPDQYIEAKRYLGQVGNAVTALRDRNVSNYFNGNWSARGKSVAELVKFMADKGLWIAPATPGDEPAYLALYHALAAFDAGMPRLATAGSSGSESGNGDK